MNRHEPPSLEQRIAATLANKNAGSELLAELKEEVEQAAQASVETAEAERTKSLDLVQCPDPREALQRIAAAELAGDRLKTAIPRLRDKLVEVLATEARERWWAGYRRVRQQRDEAVTLFEGYRQHAEAIAGMFALAAAVDREVSRVNGSAPDGVGHRLRPVELEARDMQAFTRDYPSLASTVELRDWEISERKLWPITSSLAAAYVQGMTAPRHPGAAWADPDVQARRRAETEKEQQRLAEHYAEATEQQESRLNREERERFGLR